MVRCGARSCSAGRGEACGFFPDEIVGRRKDLTASQKLLYARMARWARLDHGERYNERPAEVWRSHANMAEELGMSSRQIRRDAARLEAVGLLGHHDRDGRKSHTYFLSSTARLSGHLRPLKPAA